MDRLRSAGLYAPFTWGKSKLTRAGDVVCYIRRIAFGRNERAAGQPRSACCDAASSAALPAFLDVGSDPLREFAQERARPRPCLDPLSGVSQATELCAMPWQVATGFHVCEADQSDGRSSATICSCPTRTKSAWRRAESSLHRGALMLPPQIFSTRRWPARRQTA